MDIFPIGGPHVSVDHWTLDQGVDIAAPGGTPLLAVRSGHVTYHDVRGFTNGRATMPLLRDADGNHWYYGHALHPACAQGQKVAIGQKIAVVGEGRVGYSTGPHLEIGLANAFGVPLGKQTARSVLAALKAAPMSGPYANVPPAISNPIGPVSVSGIPLTEPASEGERKWDYSQTVRAGASAQAGHAHVVETGARNVLAKLARWRLPR